MRLRRLLATMGLVLLSLGSGTRSLAQYIPPPDLPPPPPLLLVTCVQNHCTLYLKVCGTYSATVNLGVTWVAVGPWGIPVGKGSHEYPSFEIYDLNTQGFCYAAIEPAPKPVVPPAGTMYVFMVYRAKIFGEKMNPMGEAVSQSHLHLIGH
jgi:hypothetical protein